MTDLEDGPEHLISLLALMRGILRIFHFVAKLEQGILDVVKAIGWRFAVAR